MAHSILIFDFGTNEGAAQEARHKIEAWQQSFRLGKKMLLKFDRGESARTDEGNTAPESGGDAAKQEPRKKKQATERKPGDDAPPASRIRLLVRLGFSNHEKLSQQRWLDRIPAEEPFKSAKGETISEGNPAFAGTADLFDSLD